MPALPASPGGPKAHYIRSGPEGTQGVFGLAIALPILFALSLSISSSAFLLLHLSFNISPAGNQLPIILVWKFGSIYLRDITFMEIKLRNIIRLFALDRFPVFYLFSF